MRPFWSRSYATARVREYGILVSTDTRQVLGLALFVCYNAPVERTQYGVFRM
jgi:3-methylcrotonyl-CoA carboxylase beta subunit